MKAYVANASANEVSVIDLSTNTVAGTVSVGGSPRGVAITHDGKRAYVTNLNDDDISVIDLATNTVVGPTIPAGNGPHFIATTP